MYVGPLLFIVYYLHGLLGGWRLYAPCILYCTEYRVVTCTRKSVSYGRQADAWFVRCQASHS